MTRRSDEWYRSIHILRALVAPSSCYTRYAHRVAGLGRPYIKLLQACEKQEKCRDAARDLVKEVDDFLSYGYEELELELKERKETREIVKRIAELIEKICEYIVKSNKNMLKTFFRTLRDFSPLET